MKMSKHNKPEKPFSLKAQERAGKPGIIYGETVKKQA